MRRAPPGNHDIRREGNTMVRALKWICIFMAAGWLFAAESAAESLFGGRRIHLSNDDNHIFRIGVTGTTAGYNFFALVKDANQQSISLGELGYWEQVPDGPSFLNNYDLQMVVKNRFAGNFQIEFQYDKSLKDIRYRILEGSVSVTLATGEYYPTMVIEKSAGAVASPVPPAAPDGPKRFLFFDFNSFDADLRKHYGKVKRLLNNSDYFAYFYYYESANYNSYYFKTYRDTAKLDTEKMGLSLEDGTLAYYQKVLDNLKSRHGDDFTGQIILVTRFGKKFARDLKKYANDIGISRDMVVTIWTYEEVR